MSKQKIKTSKIKRIKFLRSRGYSLKEIQKSLNFSLATISKYSRDVEIIQKYKNILLQKQSHSKINSKNNWRKSEEDARRIVSNLGKKEKIILLCGIYWGEGTKKELNLINSDPDLLKIFVDCLQIIGVPSKDIVAGVRLYSDLDKNSARVFWSEKLNLPLEQVLIGEIISGKKNGKLTYGMCRIRVRKGGSYFKLIMSMINLIKREIVSRPRSSMDRMTHS